MTPPNLDSAEVKTLIQLFRKRDDKGPIKALIEIALKAGWIHRSQALEVVEVCKKCRGYGIIEMQAPRWTDCPICQGRGIVLTEQTTRTSDTQG